MQLWHLLQLQQEMGEQQHRQQAVAAKAAVEPMCSLASGTAGAARAEGQVESQKPTESQSCNGKKQTFKAVKVKEDAAAAQPAALARTLQRHKVERHARPGPQGKLQILKDKGVRVLAVKASYSSRMDKRCAGRSPQITESMNDALCACGARTSPHDHHPTKSLYSLACVFTHELLEGVRKQLHCYVMRQLLAGSGLPPKGSCI